MSINVDTLQASLQNVAAALQPVATFAGALSAVFPQAAGVQAAVIAVEAAIALEPELANLAGVLRAAVTSAVSAQTNPSAGA
jgi:hypothetical protein